jgi:hypothetical protein
MRLLHYGLVSSILLVVAARIGVAQSSGLAPAEKLDPPAPVAAGQAGAPTSATAGQELGATQAEIEKLRTQQAALLARTQDDELKKKVEILEKQIDTLEKLVRVLTEQVRKQAAAAAGMEQMQVQAATLQARSVQAAQRDKELAAAIGDLREHQDAQERYGPWLPAPLKELFLPSGTSETPLSIYGTLAFGYSNFQGNAATAANGAGRPSTFGGFYFGEFTPDFLLKLNDWILLEAEIAVTGNGSVTAGSFAQADFFINDWLTIIAGRFVAPIGFFNERLNNPWINKLPGDAPGSGPLPWLQVLPPFSCLGVQAAGAFYLGCSPVKMEYNAYVSNGLNVTPATPGSPTINELANLENMQNTFNIISNLPAFGGRIGFWWPEAGWEVGLSAMHSPDYIRGFTNSISLWAVDVNYHKGNWDLRAEYGMLYQQAQPFLPTDITRQGFYAQAAYRPRDCPRPYLQNVELVYRYCYVNFTGIDPTTLDLTTFSTPVDVPTRRQQHEFGVNYWFAPRLVLKCAYQVNDEPGFHLHDNQFITELAWGW